VSINTVEALLHKIGNDKVVKDWDLHAIVDSGVSPMALMFAYVAAHGGLESRDEYIRILKAPKP